MTCQKKAITIKPMLHYRWLQELFYFIDHVQAMFTLLIKYALINTRD